MHFIGNRHGLALKGNLIMNPMRSGTSMAQAGQRIMLLHMIAQLKVQAAHLMIIKLFLILTGNHLSH